MSERTDRTDRTDREDQEPVAMVDGVALYAGEYRKSAQTRRRIMDAAIECLADLGYQNTTVLEIAQRAGMTRSTVLYHFPSRQDLMAASVDYVFQRRGEDFIERTGDVPEGKDVLDHAIDVNWEILALPSFRAFVELLHAARTAPDLATVLYPRMQDFEAKRFAAAQQFYATIMDVEAPSFVLLRDMVRFSLEGMAMAGPIPDVAKRAEALRTLLKQQLRLYASLSAP